MGDKVTFGHYRVVHRDDGSLWELGSNAMGVTYKALDRDLERPVALRVINSGLVADEVNRNLFLGEACAAAGLRHSNIASVYYLGKDEEQFFCAMEFIEGQTTESYIARYGPMPLRSALLVAWQVSKAVAAAARQRFVLRDIKPANIMIVADSEEGDWPSVKLIDFGLVPSALPSHDSDGTTRPGYLRTASARSQEQIGEAKMDGRSDIYSLGCTLWYLLTGESPLTGSLTGGFAQHLGNEPPWACRVWHLLTGEAPIAGLVTSALTQQTAGEPPWEKLEPFPRRIRRLLRRMLEEPSQRTANAMAEPRGGLIEWRVRMELQREIEQCLADVERGEALAARIALPLKIGRQWLIVAPWTRRAAIFGVSAMSLALTLAYWDSQPPPPPVPQTSGVVRAQDSADSYKWLAREMPGWSYFGALDEPFRSVALARSLSFAETVAADPGIVGAKSWLHAESIWDGGIAVKDDSWGGKEGGWFSAALAPDYPFGVGGSESKNAGVSKGSIRDKDKLKKTTKRYVSANYAKKPHRRLPSRTRDQGFSPMNLVQEARRYLRRVIDRIF
jgi:serine/threonine protein kinase